MKLSKLYSNDQHKFNPIQFRSGLNVVLAEIRRPEDTTRDTHDLGKTTLGRLIDFCLLKGKSKDFFLFANDAFEDFVFFLEVELFDGRYLTIRRSVEAATRIALMLHDSPHQNFSEFPEQSWTHWNISFEKAKEIVDGILDFRAIEMNLQNITNSLQEEKQVLNPQQIAQIYKEAIGFFPEQIKIAYENLVQFNRSITVERNEYLRKEKEKIQSEIKALNHSRQQLSTQQSNLLSFLKDTNIFAKYKQLGTRLRDIEVQIGKLLTPRFLMMPTLKLRKIWVSPIAACCVLLST